MSSEPTPVPLAAAHHQPLDPNEDDGLINQQGCGKVYLLLEECLGLHDRDWRKCQAEVKAFRNCYARHKAAAANAAPTLGAVAGTTSSASVDSAQST